MAYTWVQWTHDYGYVSFFCDIFYLLLFFISVSRENGENSISTRNAVISNSDNEFSDNDEDFVITSDHESNSEISDSEVSNKNEVEVTEEAHSTGYFYGKKSLQMG